MRLKSVRLSNFKRFKSLQLLDLPSSSKLVVLVGPNGSGRSSLFESFNLWQSVIGFNNYGTGDIEYYAKKSDIQPNIAQIYQQIQLDFHTDLPNDERAKKRIFYFRSAYRNEADFQISSINRLGFEEDRRRLMRLIDNDFGVADNYQAIAGATLGGLFSGAYDDLLGKQIVNEIIGDVQRAMLSIFPDLSLNGLGDPLTDGTFLFTKGESKFFPYKNLSGGEKAAFDLILDFVIKARVFRNTIFCIDEPETHINSKLQGALLAELVRLVPTDCQIWISTHSIGMMREASKIQRTVPESVSFINFFDQDFDNDVALGPTFIDRDLWKNILDVAMGDLADLVAPRRVVLCEGKPSSRRRKDRAEFDARCYRSIFAAEYPIVHSSQLVTNLKLGKTQLNSVRRSKR